MALSIVYRDTTSLHFDLYYQHHQHSCLWMRWEEKIPILVERKEGTHNMYVLSDIAKVLVQNNTCIINILFKFHWF